MERPLMSQAPGWEWSQLNPDAEEFALKRAVDGAAWDFFQALERRDLVEPAEIGRGCLDSVGLLWRAGLGRDEASIERAVAIAIEGFTELFEKKIAEKNAITETVRARLRAMPPKASTPYLSPADKVAALKSAFAGCSEPWNGIELSALVDYGDIQQNETVVAVYSDRVVLAGRDSNEERTISRIQLHEVCRPVTHQNEDSWHRQFPSASAIEAAGAAERAGETA